MKWAIFGKLSSNEIKNLKEKVNYTLWEFFFGFIIFYHNNTRLVSNSDFIIQDELIKFGGLFLVVLLLKCFHYLSVYRAFSIFYINRTKPKILPFIRFATGLILLNLIDGLLAYRFYQEVMYNHLSSVTIENNILIAIFGFEILNLFPLILLTSIKYGLNCYEYWKFDGLIDRHQYNDLKILKWCDFKLKVNYICEFLVNLLRFSMTCIFSVIFLYLYTFPLHILPSSYLSLRVLILKTRCLVDLKKRQFKLQKLLVPPNDSLLNQNKCIVCFEEFSTDHGKDVRVLKNCNHLFHYGCLKNWIDYSSCCPICRKKI